MVASAGTGTRAITGMAGGALASRSTVATTRRGVWSLSMNCGWLDGHRHPHPAQ
jgi:hypothetical protein